MAKKPRYRGNKTDDLNIHALATAIDLILEGQDAIAFPDFLMMRHDPFHADIGHLNPQALRTYDQPFVDALMVLQAEHKVPVPANLKSLYQEYRTKREQLCEYQAVSSVYSIEDEILAAKELGNFDPYLDKIVIRNEAELNLFYDYLALYRKREGKREIIQWGQENPSFMTPENEAVVMAYQGAKFVVLRLEQNLSHGAIKVTNIITKEETILMDKALNESKKEGLFFVCSLLEMENYVMTSGGGIPLDPKSPGGKSAITRLKKHLEKLRTSKQALNDDIAQCAKDIYGFCLRSGALEHMTVK